MDRRNQPPAAFWGESLNFWCRLWQAQIEQSMRFWGALAAQAPRPSAAKLAAEAESLKEISRSARRSGSQAKAVAKKTAPKPVAAKPVPAKAETKPATIPAPMH